MEDRDLAALCLNPDDVARVAEFFDCDVDATFEFMRKIWLPDARETAVRIMNAILTGDWTSLAFLCDHLREGARSVGATRIMHYASEIERAAEKQASCSPIQTVHNLRAALDTLGALLSDRGCAASISYPS